MTEMNCVIFQSTFGTIGTFRCPPSYPNFENTGPIQGGHIIVFPRTTVRITHIGREPVIADPTTVMFYNEEQRYRRGKISERGDLCEWFAFDPTVIQEAVSRYDPSVEARAEEPFSFPQGPSDPQIYISQRLVVEHLLEAEHVDRFLIQEMMCAVLQRAIGQAYQARGVPLQATPSKTQQAHAALANEAKAIIATRFQEALTLEEIAAELCCSTYHLCRVFRRQSGVTLHRYLNQLRLRTALEFLADPSQGLTDLALRLGYSSHSHFTQAFRTTFGMPPSRLRAGAPRHLRQMSKNLIA